MGLSPKFFALLGRSTGIYSDYVQVRLEKMILNVRFPKSPGRAVALPSLLVAFALMSGLSAVAYADIVADGGFEGADPTRTTKGTDYFTSGNSIDGGSWTVTAGEVGVDTLDSFVFAGSKSVFLDGPNGGPSSLTQILTTVVGQMYEVGFWADANAANTFSVTFGGVAMTGAPTSVTQNGFPSLATLGNHSQFVFYSGTAVATSTSTDLVFSASVATAGNTVEIDGVSASTVPEPGTIGLLSLALAGILGVTRRTSQSRAR